MNVRDEFVLALIQKDDEKAKLVISQQSVTALHDIKALSEACSKGNLEVCRLLLEKGCDPNLGELQAPPMSDAILSGVLEVVELLAAAGANLNQDRILISAINSSSPDGLRMVKCIVDHGADVNETHAMFGDENNRKSALDFAAGKPAVIEFLRSVGAKTAAEIARDG